MDLQEVKQKIAEADFVLAGIGEEWRAGDSSGDVKPAYERLARLLEGKDYFIVTTLEDGLIFDSTLSGERIAAPFAGEKAPKGSSEEQWKTYMQWLMGTLNRKLFILELGEGFENPSVIRWPFEKTACLNLKSYLCRVHRRFYQLPDGLEGRGRGEAADSVRWILSEEAFC
jgi:hypothetical protein